MKAVQFHEFGGPDVLRYEEAERPTPGPGQVLVKVAGTSFNPVDASFRAGFLREVIPVELPHIPGIDLAGTVVEGDGFAPGESVIGLLQMTENGASAEYVLAPGEILAKAPTSVPLADAAALPAGALTAWQALFEHAGLRSGQRILINGAGGAVGGFAVQFAARAGAHVIATASPRSAAAVRSAGADEIIDYTVSKVSPDPVDVVLNLVRADEASMAALVALVKPGGVLVSTAAPAHEDKDRKVKTISMYVRNDTKQLTEIANRLDAGTLKLDISARYPLTEIAKVHEQSAAGALRGKVIIEITS
jgi:NADPH:quinone reductase-like Zn-dependent oxidoreductase